ncbi:MAG: Fe-S oxidoreductase, partial [Actinobacteria bacterium]|nr:Fe-S oxidoreductase [Actinomycetota bacterium]
MTLLLGLLAYSVTAVALVLIAIRGREMYRRIKSGQPDPTRSGEKGARLRNAAAEILGHGKMLKFTGSGIAHWFVMIGFVALA